MFKQLIRYTANNFLQDKEAVGFVKDYLTSIIDLSQPKANQEQKTALKQIINNYDPQAFLTVFNQVMDQVQGMSILGDGGLKLQYALAGGYLIKTDGSINFKLDSSQLAPALSNAGEQEIPADTAKGNLNLTVNWSTDLSDINSSLDIQIPATDANNSFNYADLMYYLSKPGRLSGDDRFQTARLISEQFNAGTVQDVIVTSGNDFPDALAAGVLARKLNAPILLAGSNTADSNEAIAYISRHLDKAGTVHIIGGNSAVSSEFEQSIKDLGFKQIERIEGETRFDTNLQIAQKLDIGKNTPVIVASSENFPDVLSICSIAGKKGYPILFVDRDELTQGVQDFISNIQPAQIYIIGGTEMISATNESKIQALVPNGDVTRISGQDRYETTGKILAMFAPKPSTVYIASGKNFPDALAGSVLASATGDPIILVDPNSSQLPPAIAAYLQKLSNDNACPQIISFGGSAAVPDAVLNEVANILKGTNAAEK
jgi:putative cell wall-binding protein